ncbi:NnrS family protein [Parasphingorhabdus sp.]|uniref:NnrS family protein n=1 Tax=Parasphingorhabdus sp. TaxID=2709688 RepID=UPI003A92B859
MARLAILFAAAHRPLFLAGVLNFALLMMWWTATLFDIHIWPIGMPSNDFPAALQHAPVMLYIMLPAFFFGFLLTVFPRWIGYADLRQIQYLPVGCAFIIASILAYYALFAGQHYWLAAALCVAGFGWLIALWHMVLLILAERRDGKGPTWHAWSAFAALCLSLAGLGFSVVFLITLDGQAYLVASSIGTFGFLLPIFFTVAHRMIPFFGSNVVKDYVSWRPYWVLALLWIFLIAHLLFSLGGYNAMRFVSASVLCALTAILLRRWWPSQKAPGLFMVLIWGFAWAPIGFAMIAVASLIEYTASGIGLALAPVHALYIGMAGSLVIAMVTRVTLGHSGRPLAMNRIAWLAFWGIQLAAVARIVAGARGEHGHWLVLAGLIWVLLVTPWVWRQAGMYLSKRADGKPG